MSFSLMALSCAFIGVCACVVILARLRPFLDGIITVLLQIVNQSAQFIDGHDSIFPRHNLSKAGVLVAGLSLQQRFLTANYQRAGGTLGLDLQNQIGNEADDNDQGNDHDQRENVQNHEGCATGFDGGESGTGYIAGE